MMVSRLKNREQGTGNREQNVHLRVRCVATGAAMMVLLLIAGCRQDMQNQPKIRSQRGSELFADHRGARPQVANTVARGQLREDSYFYTGVIQAADGYREEKNEMPFPVTLDVLKRGQERFNIYCSPCHSRAGNGLGEIVQRGYKPGLLDAAYSGGSLGGGSLHSRLAVEPGGQGRRRSFGRTGAQPEGDCAGKTFAGRLCRAVDAAGDGCSGASQRYETGQPGAGSDRSC